MRISVNKEDEGYRKDAHAYLPFLNGEKVEDCMTADEERGYVLVYIRDEEDHLCMNRITNRIKTKRLSGTVMIVPPAGK